MIIKINLTVLIVLMLLFFGSWTLMNVDEKREEFWFRSTMLILNVMVLLSVGDVITAIWME